jgi:hypothetical protein
MSTYVDSDTNVACLAAKAVDRDAMGRGHLEGMTSALGFPRVDGHP